MPRLRFIVDRPRGKRGGNNDERHLFKSLDSAKVSAGSHSKRVYRRGVAKPAGKVLAIDLDDLIPVDASTEDQLGHHERHMLRHTAELERLGKHALGGKPVITTTELALIREAISEWDREDGRGTKKTAAAHATFFVLRDLWRAGKLG